MRLDLRSLAVLRMALGFLVLLDTLLRARDLSALYTDDGLMPRVDLVEWSWTDPWLCLHLGGSGPLAAAALFGLTACLAIGLLGGWRTRAMTFGCWLMLSSLYQRNPLVNDRGDLELILVLFWCLFLPLGARWSLDARRLGTPEDPTVLSAGSVALLLQFAQIYLFAALLKHGLPWLRGDALEHSLRSALFSTPQGLFLTGWPDALNALTHPVMALELLIPFLLLSPVANGPVRSVGVFLLVVFHALVGLLLQLGLFPLIGALLPLGCLPSWFWERAGRGPEALLDRLFPASRRPGRAGALPLPVSLFVGVCVAYTVACNLFMLREPSPRHIPDWLRPFGRALRLEQHWDLFAPLPPLDGWFVLRAEVDGRPVDLLRDGPVSLERPRDPSRVFPNHRWRMLMIALIFPGGVEFRDSFARYQARLYRERHPDARIGRLELIFVVQLVDDAGIRLPPRVWELWSGPTGPET